MPASKKQYSRVFAIGDIHGCAGTFRKLLFDELRVQRQDLLICVGDYIDRGPDSKGVVDLILRLREDGHDVVALRGNHEQIMLDSTKSQSDLDLWLANGGVQTLTSFDARSYLDFDSQYKTFFEETLYYFIWNNCIFVHAGLNFSIDKPLSDHHAMLWTRETAVDADWLGDRIVVHGHTPWPRDSISEQNGNDYNLDSGCVYPHRPGMGWLCALELKSMKYSFVRNVDN